MRLVIAVNSKGISISHWGIYSSFRVNGVGTAESGFSNFSRVLQSGESTSINTTSIWLVIFPISTVQVCKSLDSNATQFSLFYNIMDSKVCREMKTRKKDFSENVVISCRNKPSRRKWGVTVLSSSSPEGLAVVGKWGLKLTYMKRDNRLVFLSSKQQWCQISPFLTSWSPILESQSPTLLPWNVIV